MMVSRIRWGMYNCYCLRNDKTMAGAINTALLMAYHMRQVDDVIIILLINIKIYFG